MERADVDISVAGNETTCFSRRAVYPRWLDASSTLVQSAFSTNHVLVWASLCITFIMCVIYVRKRQAKAAPAPSAVLSRKRDFVARAGDAYGYATSPSGHIDTWRAVELPNLIPPIGITQESKDEPEVYLDYAGAAVPTKTQLHNIMESSLDVLANPHSTGPAASRTSRLMETAKKRVLDHFHGHPGRYAGMPDPSCKASSTDRHPGYDVVWTSGATESLRIVAEHFPWTPACASCGGNQSTLVYSRNSHTSVVGMRGPALSKGASFECRSLDEVCLEDRWNNDVRDAKCTVCGDTTINNLLVLPLQCSFGGTRANNVVADVVQRLRHSSNERSKWYTMLDLAKAASTEPIDLKALDPDFACISFYKMFGDPTGLGALFVKRDVASVLSPQAADDYGLFRYFGGGSVDAVLAGGNFAVGRRSGLASLENGSVHFRGIASLLHGFDELERLGGMTAIHRHTTALSMELVRRLKELRHGNGRPVFIIYGGWERFVDANVLNMEDVSLPGPTIAFNVLRNDGSFVGYNEVSKLAALNRPPLQLRTGCFCNPGACQEALQLSDEEIRNNYLTSHHVCGDNIDIINDKPTGAIRASFGKDSIWEDLDALVMFLKRHFVHSGIVQSVSSTPVPSVSKVVVSELYIFPIKSCSAQRVSRWMMHADSGRLAYDREFALVDSSGTAMRLRTHPRMSLLKPRIDLKKRTMTVSAPDCQDLVVSLDSLGVYESVVHVCGNKCGGKLFGNFEVSEWFSSFLGVQCWLARHCGVRDVMTGSSGEGRSIDLRKPNVAFANEEPLLLISERSVETLNEVLLSQGQQTVSSRHFRPNLVVRSNAMSADISLQGANPEDGWTNIRSIESNFQLDVVGQCARCSMVDVDPSTGRKGKTLRALADYRRRNGQITFGVFLGASTSKEQSTDTIWINEGDVFQCT